MGEVVNQVQEVTGLILLFWLLFGLSHLRGVQGLKRHGRKWFSGSQAVTPLTAAAGLMDGGFWACLGVCKACQGVSVVFGHSLEFGYVLRAVLVEPEGPVTVEQ